MAAKKGHQILGIIYRTIQNKDKDILISLYKSLVMLNLALSGQFRQGWPWVDFISACAIIGTGRKRTLEVSIVGGGGWRKGEEGVGEE